MKQTGLKQQQNKTIHNIKNNMKTNRCVRDELLEHDLSEILETLQVVFFFHSVFFCPLFMETTKERVFVFFFNYLFYC